MPPDSKAHEGAEPTFARASAGLPADDLRPAVQAAMFNAALRAAAGHCALRTADGEPDRGAPGECGLSGSSVASRPPWNPAAAATRSG